MGVVKWRVQEAQFLQNLANSEIGRKFLSADTPNWWADARNWFTRQYLDQFAGKSFPAETEEEFALRQQWQPRAKLTIRLAETVEDRIDREKHIAKVCMHVRPDR